jgi:uncharacterized membrane protein YvbJ
MVCPSCGINNPDDSKQCSGCGYKFSFGYAYNDPKKMMFFKWISKTNTTKTKIARYFVALLLLIMFVLVILSWLKSI